VLWIKTDEPNIVSQIGSRWKKAMDVPNRLKYHVHRDGKFIKKSVDLVELLFLSLKFCLFSQCCFCLDIFDLRGHSF
jgi:hypothetical protein